MGKKYLTNNSEIEDEDNGLTIKLENRDNNFFNTHLNNINPYSGNYFFGKPEIPLKHQFSNINFFSVLKSFTEIDESNLLLLEEDLNDIIIEENKSNNLKIRETVCSANLNCKINIKDLSNKIILSEYNPRRFNALILRINNPKSMALIFNNGNILCSGNNSTEKCKKAINIFSKFLIKFGYPIKVKKFTVENIVASFKCDFYLNLDKFNHFYLNECKYIPEMFPGIIFNKNNIVYLIFNTGNVCITGGKSRKKIIEAYEFILPILNNYKEEINI